MREKTIEQKFVAAVKARSEEHTSELQSQDKNS